MPFAAALSTARETSRAAEEACSRARAQRDGQPDVVLASFSPHPLQAAAVLDRAPGPGACRMLMGDRIVEDGAVGVLLQGPIQLRTIVSQGCRPIGRHMVITRAQENIIEELSGKSPLAQLQELWQQLEPRDQKLF